MKVKIFILIFFALLFSTKSTAQYDDSLPSDQYMDSFVRAPRTTKIGKLLKKYTYRIPNKPLTIKLKASQEVQPDYVVQNGKVIRNIIINSYDPFGANFKNPNRKTNKFEKIGNVLHGKTKNFTIRNLLLFKKNDTFSADKIVESERLLRSLGYIRTAEISIDSTYVSKDSVDVIINTLDAWAIYANGSMSTSSLRLNTYTRNFVGLGHYFSVQYRTRFKEDLHGYNFRYIIPNIAKQYITFHTQYHKDLGGNYNKFIQLNRDFYSPLANWAGGIYLAQTFYRDSVPDLTNSYFINQDFKYNEYNTWAGTAIPISEKQDINNRVNLYIAAKYNHRKYTSEPNLYYDPYNHFSDHQLLLFATGINSYSYKKERYLFYDNRVEDIPVGKRLRFTYGFQWKNQQKLPYYSLSYTYANQYSFGYISNTLQYGTFRQNQQNTQGVFRAETLYFSHLQQLGNWKFRHFIYHDFVYGINRLDYEKDRISINGHHGITGFSSYHLRGTQKTTLTLQTQSYSPYSLMGFRFNPFINLSVGMINSHQSQLFKNEPYTKIGLGVQITNDYLTLSRFNLSISYFPHIPDRGYNIFEFNKLRNDDFNYHHFQIGEPNSVPYH